MEYKVEYSGRKTLSLCIKDGCLVVKAPHRTPGWVISDAVKKHESWINKNLQKQKERNDIYSSLTDEDIKKLRKLAKQILPAKVEHFANIMGLNYGRTTITSAKTRFGSCSSKGNLAFSYLLLLYPEAAIDYVVVHELAHLIEMNHSKNFYKIVESVLPDYKVRKKLLKK